METTEEGAVRVTFVVSRDELARRGRLGGLATAQRHDSREVSRPGREKFLSRFGSDEERKRYFSELSRRSAVAKRTRKQATEASAEVAP